MYADEVCTTLSQMTDKTQQALAQANLLVKEGQLNAVIDFGQLAIGDPACDLAIAWNLFAGQSRRVFQEAIRPDEKTWLRAMAWTL